MYRKVAPTGFLNTAPSRAQARQRSVRRDEPTRWPPGVGITLALMVSLAMWGALVGGAMTLIAMF